MWVNVQLINDIKDFILAMFIVSISAFTMSCIVGDRHSQIWLISTFLLGITAVLLITSHLMKLW